MQRKGKKRSPLFPREILQSINDGDFQVILDFLFLIFGSKHIRTFYRKQMYGEMILLKYQIENS